MSKHHCFLTVKDLNWQWFNILTFGLQDVTAGVDKLCEIHDAAMMFVKNRNQFDGSYEDPAFFVHVYGHCTVMSFHLHMVDLAYVGPTFKALAFKNLRIEDCISALKREELKVLPKELNTRDTLAKMKE